MTEIPSHLRPDAEYGGERPNYLRMDAEHVPAVKPVMVVTVEAQWIVESDPMLTPEENEAMAMESCTQSLYEWTRAADYDPALFTIEWED